MNGHLAAVDAAYPTAEAFEGKTLDEARTIVQDAELADSGQVR